MSAGCGYCSRQPGSNPRCPEHGNLATVAALDDLVPADAQVVTRDTDGTALRGPTLPCGCPLDSGCDGRHPGRLP